LARCGCVSAPSDPVHAVTAQALPPYDVLHRVGAVAQLPGPMSVLPVHVERRKLSVLDFRQPQAVCCGARARVWRGGYGAWVDQAWTEFVFPCITGDIPQNKYRPAVCTYHKGLGLPVLRNTLRTCCFAWNAPAGLHTLHSARSYIPREHACCTSSVQTFPYKAAAVRPRKLPGQNRKTGRLLAAEHSSGALDPFRASLGSHCPLRGS
jgi:hypothetical protein